jgi:glycosyltransferase involved in cell wall biosynthesis
MNIAFIHPHKSFLPGIGAYCQYFSARGIKTEVCFPEHRNQISADVEWYFMGSQIRRNKKALTIHEYASASTPPFEKAKDRLKKMINCKPDYRIFDSEYAQKQFGFLDQIPSGIRQSGVYASAWRGQDKPSATYDFIYVGSLEKERRLEKLFSAFSIGDLKNRTLLILSKNYKSLQVKFQDSTNIRFRGPVDPSEVYSAVRQAKYALNFVPNIRPFSEQPSSKLLDYAACEIPVVTTDYPWVRRFQAEFGGRYFFLNPDLSNFRWEPIAAFAYEFPRLDQWTWECQIRNSGILAFLKDHGYPVADLPDQ